jgi:dolichyl-phosphate-mannose--protein O-mannosyl transferase
MNEPLLQTLSNHPDRRSHSHNNIKITNTGDRNEEDHDEEWVVSALVVLMNNNEVEPIYSSAFSLVLLMVVPGMVVHL